jgi:hypothetical protein
VSDYRFGFRAVDHYGAARVTDQLRENLSLWLQWGFLGVGAFTNVGFGSAPAHGGQPSRLRAVFDPRYPAGGATGTTVWEGFRADWVWESGVPYATAPTAYSGVHVGGTFAPASATGAYAHRVSYPEGRVYFASPLASGTPVSGEFAFRHVHVRRADEPWFQELAERSLRADEPATSGLFPQNRVELPAVVLQPVNRVDCRPYEIGSPARIHRQDVLLHALAETPGECGRLHDVLADQYDRRVPAFDLDAATLPLDYRGGLAPGARTFPQLVAAAPWRQIRVADVKSSPPARVGGLHWATVRYTLEVDCP